MKQTLIDLFTSKKFLAALSAITIYLAGRFGFAVDPAALDRIFAALLVYVGAQGVADVGKGAAQIRAASDKALNPPLNQPVLNAVSVLAIALLALGGAATLSACDTGRARAANGTAALLDCTADARAPVIADLGVTLRAWVLKHVAGDGRTIDLAQLERDAQALKGEVIGSCALVTALAILATPAQAPAPQGLLAAPAGPTPEQWRAALVEVRAELGVKASP